MEILPEIYFKGENILVTGSLTWQEYPDKFWGVGPATPDDAEENYTPRSFVLKASLQKKIWPSQNLFAGIQVLFSTLKIVKTDPGRSLDRGEWPGSTGETTTGLGFILNRDTRDNIFFPMKGDYWRFGAVFNQKFLGGQYNYASFELDLRKYLTLFGRHVLALQGLVQATAGTPAFVNYPRLGGDSIMRGYYYGRYRDKWLMATQAEYRLPLWWRLGLLAFAGLGDVAGRLSEFNSDTMKYSAGFGIRFKIVPKEGANLRLDFAWGKRSSGIYFTAREAF